MLVTILWNKHRNNSTIFYWQWNTKHENNKHNISQKFSKFAGIPDSHGLNSALKNEQHSVSFVVTLDHLDSRLHVRVADEFQGIYGDWIWQLENGSGETVRLYAARRVENTRMGWASMQALSAKPINAMLSDDIERPTSHKQVTILQNGTIVGKIFSAVTFIARLGLPFRGDDEQSGSLTRRLFLELQSFLVESGDKSPCWAFPICFSKCHIYQPHSSKRNDFTDRTVHTSSPYKRQSFAESKIRKCSPYSWMRQHMSRIQNR